MIKNEIRPSLEKQRQNYFTTRRSKHIKHEGMKKNETNAELKRMGFMNLHAFMFQFFKNLSLFIDSFQ